MGATCSCSVHAANDQRVVPYLSADTLENFDVVQSEKASASNKLGSEKTIFMTTSGNSASAAVLRRPASLKDILKRAASLKDAHRADLKDFPPRRIFDNKLWDGQELCKQDASVRAAFTAYVFSNAWADKVSIDLHEQIIRRRPTQDTQEITFNDYSVKNRSHSTDSKDMEAVANTIMRCTQLKIRDSMDMSKKRHRFVETCFTSEQMHCVLIATLWPLFYTPDNYSLAVAVAGSRESFFRCDESVSTRDSVCSRPNDSEKVKQVREIYSQTAQYLTAAMVDRLLVQGQWADNILAYVEKLPFSVSISSNTSGYPVIYVNEAFEQTTKYPRQEVLGRSHSILQCENTERDQTQKIADALRKGESVKVAITNKKKNGHEFLNFLALRPVLTRETEECVCVIAVQYDISKAEASLKEMKMINDFLSLMGNILKG